MPCYGCRKEGHILSNCRSTSGEQKNAIYAIIKKSDFKTIIKGAVVVQVEDGKGGKKSDPPSDNCQKANLVLGRVRLLVHGPGLKEG